MNIIELERWKPSAENPRKLEYAGQPAAEEVFQELKHRLEGMGYLPDEYFLLDDVWENGREIPKGADIICKVDYGESEGVYLDIGLTWYDENEKRYVIKDFITGKTLGETGDDLDRMYLIASAVTKAFHGGEAAHARYMKIGGVEENTGGAVVHLSPQEQRTIIDALAEQRERQENAMSQTEQLLRRMTGSITGYMDMVGQRPVRLNGYDRAVLAIRDGELAAFKELWPKERNHADELFLEAAGRPGEVGKKMMELVLSETPQFSEHIYRVAVMRAIDTADQTRVDLLLKAANDHVENLSPTFYGQMACHAFADHRQMARDIIKQCSNEQIVGAPSALLQLFASASDFQTMSTLVEKGISGGETASGTLHMLTYEGRNSWMAERLLQQRMWVDTDDYEALSAVVKNNAVSVAKLLLDGGMDFGKYRQIDPCSGSTETIRALEEHWQELQTQAQEQGEQEEQGLTAPEIGGMTLG